MEIFFKIVLQLTIATTVMAFNFDGFMKNLPIPADIKAVIMDMQQKQKEYSMPDADGVTSMDFKSGTPISARKRNEMLKPTSTVMSRVATKMNKPVTQINTPLSAVTVKPRGSFMDTEKTTGKPENPSTKQPPSMIMPPPMPIVIPNYVNVPVMLPMRTYFEKVEHDHPSLCKIKQMIEEDNMKWKEENSESGSDISVMIDDDSIDQSKETDTDTDTDADIDTNTDTHSSSISEYSDVDPDYYDDMIRIKVNGRDR